MNQQYTNELTPEIKDKSDESLDNKTSPQALIKDANSLGFEIIASFCNTDLSKSSANVAI